MSETGNRPPPLETTLRSKSNEPATRWARLGAAIIDGVVNTMITTPIMFLTGGFEGVSEGNMPPMGYLVIMGLIGIVVFGLVNGQLLVSMGQTVGKKVIGIKIVDLEGKLPTLNDHLLKRYAVFMLPGQIPSVGQWLSLVNILFIFGNEKRCVHDLIAGTQVVKCQTSEA